MNSTNPDCSLLLDASCVDFFNKKSTAWLREICQARKLPIEEPSISTASTRPATFQAKWKIVWIGGKIFEAMGPAAGSKLQAKHLGATAVMILMGITPSFLATHNVNGYRRLLPIFELEPAYGYIAPVKASLPAEVGNCVPGPSNQPESRQVSDKEDPPLLTLASALGLPSTARLNPNMSVSDLKEICNKVRMEQPVFTTLEAYGPVHQPTHTVECTVAYGRDKYRIVKNGQNSVKEMNKLAASDMIDLIIMKIGVRPIEPQNGTSRCGVSNRPIYLTPEGLRASRMTPVELDVTPEPEPTHVTPAELDLKTEPEPTQVTPAELDLTAEPEPMHVTPLPIEPAAFEPELNHTNE